MTDTTDNNTDGTERPAIEVTIRMELPVPDDASKEESIEHAKEVFSEEIESDEGEVEFQYLDPGTEQSDSTTEAVDNAGENE